MDAWAVIRRAYAEKSALQFQEQFSYRGYLVQWLLGSWFHMPVVL
jgi:hypothetical protein